MHFLSYIPAIIENKYPVRRPVKKISVMAHDYGYSGKALKVVLQNRQGLDIEIIRRLVQYQYIRCGHQHPYKVQSPLFSARKLSNK